MNQAVYQLSGTRISK